MRRKKDMCAHGEVVRVKLLCLLVLAGLLAGCIPKKTVYLHRDWASPSASSKSSAAPGGLPAPSAPPHSTVGSPAPSQAPITTGGPIMGPTVVIREMELGSESELESGPGVGLQTESEVPSIPRKEVAEPATPQRYASMHLVEQAKTSLEQGKIDEAINMYEQAVRVDVYNGEAFFGLARAWHMKGFQEKSLEFARRADVLFQGRPERLKEVYLLQAEIYRQLGDTSRAEAFLREASRL